MKIVIMYNPIAGKGRAAEACRSAVEILRGEGHEVHALETRLEPIEHWLVPALDRADVLVAVGGDGTVRLGAPAATRTAIPIYQIPLGTENLFAREFGMDRDPRKLLDALRRNMIKHMDLGRVNGQLFLHMVSVGFDAEVVHDLAAHRSGAISHAAYIMPIIRQFVRWRPPHLQITVDGERIDGDQPGYVIIANSRQYAGRLDPAREALIDDGRLEVVFFPTRSRLGLLNWNWKCLRGVQMKARHIVSRRGRVIHVECGSPRFFQVDGDKPEPDSVTSGTGGSPSTTPLEIGITPGSLPVLIP